MGRNLTLLVLSGWEVLLARAGSARQAGWVAHNGQVLRSWCLALLCFLSGGGRYLEGAVAGSLLAQM